MTAAEGPLSVKCPACSAKPGEHCAGVVDASKNFAEPHNMRVLAAASNDLERAREKRAPKTELDPGPSEHLTTLSIAVIRLSDACGLDREDLIAAFSEVARELPVQAVSE